MRNSSTHSPLAGESNPPADLVGGNTTPSAPPTDAANATPTSPQGGSEKSYYEKRRKRFWLTMGWICIPLLTLASQSAMKMLAAATGNESFSSTWLDVAAHSHWAWALVAAEILSFLLWMHVLAHVEVSRAVPLTAVSYLLILAASQFVFDENLTFYQCFGGILILSGVWLISTMPKDQRPKQKKE